MPVTHKSYLIYSTTRASAGDGKTVRIDNEYGSAAIISVSMNTVSSAGSTDSLQVSLLSLFPGTTANPYTIIQSSVITGTGAYVVKAGAGLSTASTTESVNALVPKDLAVQFTVGTTNAGFTARIGLDLM